MKKEILYILLLWLLIFEGCTPKKNETSITEGGMKCGAGKCGASMVDGSTILVKKKINILNQLEIDDNRRECVLSANSSKQLYNCVRVEETQRLTTKCDTSKTIKKESSSMKCQAGKCGDSM